MGMHEAATIGRVTRTSRARTRPRAIAPVIFIHGIVANGAKWRTWMDDLRRMGVPAIAVDVAEQGCAPRQAFLDAIDAARATLLARAGLPANTKVTLIGFSSGGLGALEWLKHNAALVDRAITVSSPLRGNELATAGAALLGPLTPEWIRDLTISRSVLTGLTPSMLALVTSFVGAAFDGIVTARSSRSPLVRTIDLADYGVHAKFHPLVQERTAAVREAVWRELMTERPVASSYQ